MYAGALSGTPFLGWFLRYKTREAAQKSIGIEPNCLHNGSVLGYRRH